MSPPTPDDTDDRAGSETDPPAGSSGGESDSSVDSSEETSADETRATESSDASTTGAPSPPVGEPPDTDSTVPFDATPGDRWWWWIAAVPVHALLAVVLGFGLFVVFFIGIISIPMMGSPDFGIAFSGLFFLFMFAVLLFVVIPGLILALMLPVALYVDGRAIAVDPTIDWEPDAALYAIVALLGLLVSGTMIGVIVAIYYLFRRHETVGVP